MEVKDLYTAESHGEGAEMQVYDQHGKPLDLFIRLVGMDSEIWQKAAREKQKRTFKRLMSQDEDSTDYDLEDMVNAAIDWRGFEQNGAALEFSKDSIRQLFKQAPYIYDQCVLFVNNRVNFTKG